MDSRDDAYLCPLLHRGAVAICKRGRSYLAVLVQPRALCRVCIKKLFQLGRYCANESPRPATPQSVQSSLSRGGNPKVPLATSHGAGHLVEWAFEARQLHAI